MFQQSNVLRRCEFMKPRGGQCRNQAAKDYNLCTFHLNRIRKAEREKFMTAGSRPRGGIGKGRKKQQGMMNNPRYMLALLKLARDIPRRASPRQTYHMRLPLIEFIMYNTNKYSQETLLTWSPNRLMKTTEKFIMTPDLFDNLNFVFQTSFDTDEM